MQGEAPGRASLAAAGRTGNGGTIVRRGAAPPWVRRGLTSRGDSPVGESRVGESTIRRLCVSIGVAQAGCFVENVASLAATARLLWRESDVPVDGVNAGLPL
jgi:hypothetical protein